MSQSETCAMPVMRHEAHFGDRVVRCFAARPAGVDQMLRGAVARHGPRDALVHDDESAGAGVANDVHQVLGEARWLRR